jgi:hypothetical protein
MSTRTVHVCDRCGAESDVELRRLVLTVHGRGSEPARDMCQPCLDQLAFFLSHPNQLVIKTPVEPPSLVSIGSRRSAQRLHS